MIRISYNHDNCQSRTGHPSVNQISLPLSKSIALRVMTMNAAACLLGAVPAEIPALPDAEDIGGMQRALQALFSSVGRHSEVNIGEGGAPLRFFTALAASVVGSDLDVYGSPALCRRPLAMLLDVLTTAGADIRSLENPGSAPLAIRGRRLSPGVLDMNPGVSSQFLSAMMMASVLWETPLRLSLSGGRSVSTPYLVMTAEIMRRYGYSPLLSDSEIIVAASECRPPESFPIEPDWSAASYFYEIALFLQGREVGIESLAQASESLQGDAACERIFAEVGVETIHHSDGSATLRCNPSILEERRREEYCLDLDLGDTPDLVPALAVAFSLSGIRFRFRNVAHLRYKESNRMEAIAAELHKLGIRLNTTDDTMSWDGARCPASPSPIETYSDHRMAMAFAPAAILAPSVVIKKPEVVGKSFPRFWDNLQALGFRIEENIS